MRIGLEQEDLTLVRAIEILRAAGRKVRPGAGVAMVWLDDEQVTRKQMIERAGIDDDLRTSRPKPRGMPER